MPVKRYNCAVEVTVDLIGGKWKPVILAHLKEGVHRYGELRRRMPTTSEKMLVQQLRELESDGLVHRTVFDTVPPQVEYTLTDEGHTLVPVLTALYDWGEQRAARTGLTLEP
ncbi:helix-turn-helix transcriptional regulator [Nocardia sp. NBC_00508]|uniref:winged helix-turn-helix transcriptional regulator n=1 Tax=Nocardia sp. NBC_00508 TaxID=2975992 RepID=UPI002E80C516|nr:helix-turn-helix domain-containing protein [Nocardia sp. NBC_00508]WUD67770.1 helix-turn-helix transcriptional regulator [Nocardia sp. NBC_00508]